MAARDRDRLDEEFEQAKIEAEADLSRAQAELKRYDAALERVRPIMAKDPTMTLREALEQLETVN